MALMIIGSARHSTTNLQNYNLRNKKWKKKKHEIAVVFSLFSLPSEVCFQLVVLERRGVVVSITVLCAAAAAAASVHCDYYALETIAAKGGSR